MPEVIMVASWRVMTVSSAALMRWKRRDVGVERRLLLGDLHGLEAQGGQLLLRVVLGGGLQLTLGGDAGAVDAPCRSRPRRPSDGHRRHRRRRPGPAPGGASRPAGRSGSRRSPS